MAGERQQLEELRRLEELEARDANARQAEFQSKPLGRPRDILAQPLRAIGAGLLGESAGGFAGGVTAAREGFPAGRETQQSVSQGIAETGQPTSRTGQIGLETIGAGVDALTDILRKGAGFVAERAERAFGEPERAEQTRQDVEREGPLKVGAERLQDEGVVGPVGSAAIQMAPEIIGTVAGGAGLARRALKGRDDIADQLKKRQSQSKEIAIREDLPEAPEGLGDAELAEYKLTSTGRAVKDETFKPLVKKGFKPNRLTEYKASTNATKNAMSEMAEIKKRGMQNDTYGIKNRPADVVGRSLLPRIEKIRAENRKAGSRINQVANTLKGKSVDFNQPIETFMDNLDNMDINLRELIQQPGAFQGTQGEVLKRIRTAFQGSDIDLLPEFQKPLANVIYRMGTNQAPDAHDLHKLKRFIDQNVTYGKQTKGMSGRIESVLKDLRRDIDGVLDDTFPEYKSVNDIYSETITALDDFQDVLPRKVDLNMSNIDKALGQELRKLESNYQVRVSMLNSLDEIERVARKYGGQFDDDLLTQAKFMTDLDEMFGATGRNTFEGRISRAVSEATKQKSKTERVADFVKNKLSPDDDEAFRQLQEMINTSSEWQ